MRCIALLFAAVAAMAPVSSAAQHHAQTAAPPAAARKPFPTSLDAAATGTLILAHGGGPEWNARVHEVVRMLDTGGPVEVSFLMGPGAANARFQDGARKLVDAGAAAIVVVPLLVSSHSGHYEQIRWLAGEVEALDETMMHHLDMAGIERANVAVPMRVARGMDDAPQIAAVLADRARALADAPADQALFLVGHGPNSAEDNAEWMKNLRAVADTVARLTGFRDVRVGLVRDDATVPVRAEAVLRAREFISLQHEITRRPVVVVPILVSDGTVSREKIPADLAGLPIVYSGETLLPHLGVARWIEARVAETRAGK